MRPPSAGRLSDQMTASPSTATSASPAAFATTTAEVIGVGHEPYGRTFCCATPDMPPPYRECRALRCRAPRVYGTHGPAPALLLPAPAPAVGQDRHARDGRGRGGHRGGGRDDPDLPAGLPRLSLPAERRALSGTAVLGRQPRPD